MGRCWRYRWRTPPAGLDLAARQYASMGTLPPMGMGKSGATVRQKIINRAAEINPLLARGIGNNLGYIWGSSQRGGFGIGQVDDESVHDFGEFIMWGFTQATD